MKDIYSPLEIDEEWDNYSPVDATAPAEASTNVPVMADNSMDQAPAPMPLDSSVTDTGVDMNNSNYDPAREAANSEIAQEQAGATAPVGIEENIAKWTANDGKTNEDTAGTDKLEFGEMGSKLPEETTTQPEEMEAPTPVKVDVKPNTEDTEIKPLSAETDNASDMPKPVEISMPSADDGTASRYDFDNTNDAPKSDAEDMGPGNISPSPVMPTMDASENSNTPEAKEDELAKEASALEDTKNMLKSRIADLNDERKEIADSKEAMLKDKQAKTDAYQQEIDDIDKGINSADSKIAELDKFIAQLEALK